MENNIKKSSMKNQLIVVLVLVILLALFLALNKNIKIDSTQESQKAQIQQEIIQNDPVAVQAQTQSSSDELDSIEADLSNTNIDSLDQ